MITATMHPTKQVICTRSTYTSVHTSVCKLTRLSSMNSSINATYSSTKSLLHEASLDFLHTNKLAIKVTM